MNANPIIRALLDDDESDDLGLSAKEIVNRFGVFDTDGLIRHLKERVNLDADYEVFHRSTSTRKDEWVQMEITKQRTAATGERLAGDPITRADLARVMRGITNYANLTGFYVPEIAQDRALDSHRYWIDFHVTAKIHGPIIKKQGNWRHVDEAEDFDARSEVRRLTGEISMRLRALANTANTIAHPHLGETEEETFSAKQYLSSILPDLVRYPIHQKISEIPGGVRRQGESHNDQWEFVYKDWLFVVSAYEKDGSQIWSAHYKAPAFGWSSEEERARGWAWSMGGDLIEKLPANYNPKTYFSKLKKMADANPNVWEKGWIPYMPEP